MGLMRRQAVVFGRIRTRVDLQARPDKRPEKTCSPEFGQRLRSG